MRGETAKRVIGLERDSREEAGAREAETKVGPVLLLAEFQPSATSRSAQATHMASNERSGAKRKEAERGRYRVGLICLSALLDSLFSYFLFVPPPPPPPASLALDLDTLLEMDELIVSRFQDLSTSVLRMEYLD